MPCSTTFPWSRTRILSASRIVDSRWAMTTVVRPTMSRLRASRTVASLMASRCEVASSRIRTGAFLRIALAIAMRCR